MKRRHFSQFKSNIIETNRIRYLIIIQFFFIASLQAQSVLPSTTKVSDIEVTKVTKNQFLFKYKSKHRSEIAYKWDIDGNPISENISFSIKLNPGIHHITLSIYTNDCNNKILHETIEFSKNLEILKNNEALDCFSVFPNPVSDRLMIKYDENKSVNLLIINSIGEQIINQPNISSNYEIDVSKWINGLYILHLEISGKTYSKKIIKIN